MWVATKKRFVLFSVVGLVLVAGALTVSTQYVAEHLGYHRHLGAPLTKIAGSPIYAPWAWLEWDDRLRPFAPQVFATASLMTYGTVVAVLGTLVTLAFRRGRDSQASTSHGSARWGTTRELRAGGMLGSEGIVLCQTTEARFSSVLDERGALKWTMHRRGQLVRHDGPEHVFVFAPTRSGKGIGIVMPTLFAWGQSALIYDIKKELWSLTAGYRRKFSYCWRFEPTAPDSVRFNPLLEIRRGDNEVRDAQVIADILVDPDGAGTKWDHWQTTAHALLVGAILHVLYAEADKSLTGVGAFLANPERSQVQTLTRMLKTSHLPTGPHPVVAQVARSMLNKAENELSGVVSTATSYLDLFRDPLVGRATSASDFRIADLMNLDHPVSLYLVVPPSDLSRLRRLIRLVLNQVGQRLTERMEFAPAAAPKKPPFLSALRTAMAPKRLAQHSTSEDDERFRREANLARKLSHGAIALTLAVDEIDGELVIAQEFLHGCSLSSLLATCLRQKETLPTPLAVHVVREVARALAYAHEQGVTHRDIAPDNVMLTFSGEVRLLDFGIARVSTDSRLTRPGWSVGREAYAAPEVAAGGGGDPRSDIYSLGVLLWQLLARRPPPVKEAIPPPSKLNPEVRAELDAVVLRAVSRDPGDRFQDVEAILKALGSHLPPDFSGGAAVAGFLQKHYDVARARSSPVHEPRARPSRSGPEASERQDRHAGPTSCGRRTSFGREAGARRMGEAHRGHRAGAHGVAPAAGAQDRPGVVE